MKKILLSLFILVSGLLLSGCTLVPKNSDSEKSEVVESTDAKATSPLENKIIIGSLWKTSDGGHTFESRSKIDKEAVAILESENSEGDDSLNVKPDDGKSESGNGTIDNSISTKAENVNGDLISTADILSIAFNSDKEKAIYVSTANDGLFRTEDAGELWKPIPFPPKNVYSFIVDNDDPDKRMFASGVVGEWGKIFRTTDSGENWEEVYTEPGEKVPVTALSQHIKDSKLMFAGTKKGTVAKSDDTGDTWKNVGQLEDYWDARSKKMIIGKKITGNVSGFDFDAKNKAQIYLFTYEAKLYYSNNEGDRWIDWELAKQREATKMQADKVNPDIIKAFRKRMAEEKMPSRIVSIAADPLISGTVYAGTSKGFYISTSYGKWWKEINIIESAKKYPIRSIAINPKISSEIVFVSGKAFYKSVDSGKTWEVVGLDVDRDVSFVAYDPFDSKYLFIGLRKFK